MNMMTYNGYAAHIQYIDPVLHAQAAALAEGKSLNAWAQEQIRKAVALA